MTILEFLLLVFAAIFGARLGIWYTNKQADIQQQFNAIHQTIVDEQREMHARITDMQTSLTRRLDDESNMVWRQISELGQKLENHTQEQ